MFVSLRVGADGRMSLSMPETTEFELLEDKLRSIAQDRLELDIAQFQFVGMDQIARAYGEKWPVQKDRVKQVAQDFLSRRLGPKDLLVAAADGFLIVYVGDAPDRSARHAEGLKNELNTFYLGEGATRPPAQVSVRVRRAPKKEIVKALGGQRVAMASDIIKPHVRHLPPIDWKFQPVWDARREAIFNYYIAPVLRETGKSAPGYRFDPNPDLDLDLVALDELSLAESEKALRTMVESGTRSLLGVAVHSSSMVKLETRGRIFGVIDKFNRDMLRYRVVQIAATPVSFPRLYLEEMYHGLKQRHLKIAISMSWNESDVRSIAKLGPVAIGFALSSSMLHGHGAIPTQELFGRIKHAADIARGAKIPFYIDGDVSPAMALQLRAVGVDIISSPAVWPLTDEPLGTHVWESSRLAA